MDLDETTRDYPARGWHAGSNLFLCLPCCDLFGHLLPGGNGFLAPVDITAPDRPCDIHLDPSRAPCSFEQAVEMTPPEDADVLRSGLDDALLTGGSTSAGGIWTEPEGAGMAKKKIEKVKEEAPAPAAPAAPAGPRWEALVRPVGSEGQMELRCFVPGIPAAEVAFFLTKVVLSLIQAHNAILPTVEEETARQVESAFVQENPAKKLLVKDGKQLWLGEQAEAGEIPALLTARGWIDAGPVPEGVRKGCDFARDAAAFRNTYLPPGPAA